MSGWKLKRTTQCNTCPWRVETNPYDIPNGYTEELHEGLRSTISEGLASIYSDRVMACHKHNVEAQVHCVGWLMNQAGVGNNIGLRFKLRDCENINKVLLRGPQHQTFDETLPSQEQEN